MPIDRTRLLLLVGSAGVAAALVGGVWLPHHRRLSSLHEQIASQEQLLVTLEHGAGDERPLTQPILRRGTPEMEVAVPSRADLGVLLEQLGQDLAEESIVVERLEANTVIEGTDFSRIPVTLECQGTYASLFNVLRRLESRARILRVDRIDVGRGSIDPAEPLSITIEMSAFSRPATEGGA